MCFFGDDNQIILSKLDPQPLQTLKAWVVNILQRNLHQQVSDKPGGFCWGKFFTKKGGKSQTSTDVNQQGDFCDGTMQTLLMGMPFIPCRW